MAERDGALRILVALVVALIAFAFPFFASGYHIYQGSQVLILAIALLGLNLLTGFNGQISLGHGAFFAIGGYGAAILITKFGLPFWAAIPLASVVCFVAGFLFGFPALRFGGLYLALATFALAVATPQILSYTGFDAFTGGSQGLSLPKPLAPLGLRLNPDQWLYLVCLVCAAALYWAARNLAQGRIGRALIAIRDQPIAAETMGVNAALYKTTCFGVSALYAGVAGGLSAIAVGFVSPESFGLPLSLAFLVGIVVGGLASLNGVLFGALFIEFVPNLSDQLTVSFGESAKALPGAIYGALLILVMAAMPTGVAGAARAAARTVARAMAPSRRAKVEIDGGAMPSRNTKERENRHDHSTHVSAIERRRSICAPRLARRQWRRQDHDPESVERAIRRSGDIRFRGRTIGDLATEDVARLGVAHVPDGRGTFTDLTVEENLRLGAYVRGDRQEVRKDFERVFRFFPRLEERRRQQAGTLSGGEQQMLAIARALLMRPSLLMLDEPSFGLAPLVVAEIFRVLGEINRNEGVSLLIVEQNASLALDLADHAVLIETGRVALSGPSQAIRADDAVRRAYLGY